MRSDAQPDAPAVSVVIPARNEERNIRRCLSSLLPQESPPIEIIVVDDQSTDRTADLVRELQAQDPRIRLLQVTRLPAGWLGKNFALSTGVQAARSDWLLLTDADTYHYPSAPARALEFAQAHGLDCLSYSPEQECGSFGEALLQPAVFQLLNEWFSYARASNETDSHAAANGQFILIRRKALDAIGSYRAVRGQIVEDVALARLLKRAGLRLHFAFGQGLVRTRMYRSFRECWSGWAKGLYALSQGGSHALVAATCRRFVLDLMPPAALVALLLQPGALEATLASGLAVAGGLGMLGRLLWLGSQWRRMGFPARHAVFYPLGSLALIGLLWYSFYCHAVAKQVEWKGRHISRTAQDGSHQ